MKLEIEVVLFDIDDTLIDFPYMIGSKAWRKYLLQATKGSDRNWNDFFTLFLVKNLKVTTMEPATNQLVQDLQNKGYSVCGLTARERKKWYDTPTVDVDILTIEQLKEANIIFDDEAFTKMYPGMAQDSEYFQGVFFADTDLKGDYLKRILENSNASEKPKKIIFIDDKLNQVESVDSVLNAFKIDHEGYWYCATDEKAKKFNPLIANIQLYYLWISKGKDILSDEEAEIIAKQSPDKDAEYYLRTLLDHAKDLPHSN